ncbi:hypothetical protein E2F47_23515 [Mycobacterium eburneum]|nr:hypothetical protein [Mycobacterium eburneum]TDH48488.1 hypothetical protein E2F47_23515 [Mycobacterium eburneum]
MSSRRLLVLIRYLPESSAFKTALRDGDWSLQEQLVTGALNELKAMRGDLWALIGHERLSFSPVQSPSMARAAQAKRDVLRAIHDDISDQLHGRNRTKAG